MSDKIIKMNCPHCGMGISLEQTSAGVVAHALVKPVTKADVKPSDDDPPSPPVEEKGIMDAIFGDGE